MVTEVEKKSGLISETGEKVIEQVWRLLESVCDPEIPVLSVIDLGVVRSVTWASGAVRLVSTIQQPTPHILENEIPVEPDLLRVEITPTYTGCPAMSMIAANIRLALAEAKLTRVEVVEVLHPAWTTDWLSEAGRAKLLEYGIAPPQSKARMDRMLFSEIQVPCPHCGSQHTEQIAEFGSTACKSLYRCKDCREPFDYFKCH